MRRLALLLAVTTFALGRAPAPAAADPSKVSYKPPVEGPVVDPFRPPPEPWLAGNRGIDYAPGVGTPVHAAADGEVVFAGQVGGELHVVVLHADGIRTSYSFLQSIAVHRGDHVRQGDVVGTAGDDLHFGARVGDTYIDPQTLFDGGPPYVYLVPDDVRRPGSEADERSGLSRFLGGLSSTAHRVGGTLANGAQAAAGAVGTAASGAGQVAASQLGDRLDELRGVGFYAAQLDPVTHAARLVQTTVDWWRQRGSCTPASVVAPPVPERRVAVLVGGLGSNGGADANGKNQADSIDAVNPLDLGYDDTVRFSYNGGSTTEQPYGGMDTTQDLRVEARRLHDLLEQVARDHPGETVDIIAHSQGGVISRAALAYEYDQRDPRLPKVASLITLASPHQGADLATALTQVGDTVAGRLLEQGVGATGVAGFNPGGPSIRQLSETSTFLDKLDRRPLPPGVRFTSIGSRGDLTVPGIRTRAPGARNVLVDVAGWTSDHSKLPGSDAGRREVALAAAGLPPTCQTLADMLADEVESDAIATGEDVGGHALSQATHSLGGP